MIDEVNRCFGFRYSITSPEAACSAHGHADKSLAAAALREAERGSVGRIAMTKTIDALLAEAAVKEVHIRYCRACDRMDFEALRACFHEHATADYGHGVWNLDEYMAHAMSMSAKFIATTHNTGNQLVEVDGDTAWAEHYLVASHRWPLDDKGDTRDLTAAVRYIDRMECIDGEWRIARRKMVLDWQRVEPVTGVDLTKVGGRRDRSDPSYAGRKLQSTG
jgi:3-phenylpropionate/cinnamic acid dioxygenase small subunit